jgi:hypothetical protein
MPFYDSMVTATSSGEDETAGVVEGVEVGSLQVACLDRRAGPPRCGSSGVRARAFFARVTVWVVM